MDYRDRILAEIADGECRRLSRKTIVYLQGIRAGLLSGEDSPLRNAWDEICIQVQHEESVVWFVYQETIEGFVRSRVQDLPLAVRQAIWLHTGSAEDWEKEAANREGTYREQTPAFEDDIVDYVVQGFVLSSAMDWTNHRIKAYLDSFTEFD